MRINVEFYDREANLKHFAELELENREGCITATNCQSTCGCHSDGRFVVTMLVPESSENKS